jgi:hypothetical protein
LGKALASLVLGGILAPASLLAYWALLLAGSGDVFALHLRRR